MMKIERQREHEWLQQLVGEWRYEAEATMKPGEPPARSQGSERVQSLDGIWIVAEGQGEMPGGGLATTLMTLGFDPERKRYVGTWIGSMMTHLWIYEGSLDAERRVLTLESEGPSMTAEGKLAKYRDVIEVLGPDARTLTSHVRGDDGTWTKFMTADYRRTK